MLSRFLQNFIRPVMSLLNGSLILSVRLSGLIICGLVSIVLVPMIRQDGGPAIFSQTRIGKNGRHFTFYKFRSMCVNAEQRKQELWRKILCGGMFKVDDDPRITPIGRFIRKTSLDELPQFWNVLMGDMSLRSEPVPNSG